MYSSWRVELCYNKYITNIVCLPLESEFQKLISTQYNRFGDIVSRFFIGNQCGDLIINSKPLNIELEERTQLNLFIRK